MAVSAIAASPVQRALKSGRMSRKSETRPSRHSWSTCSSICRLNSLEILFRWASATSLVGKACDSDPLARNATRRSLRATARAIAAPTRRFSSIVE